MIIRRQKPIASLILATLLLSGVVAVEESGQLTAGDIDDNLNWAHYLKYYRRKEDKLPQDLSWPNLQDRVVIKVKDENGDPFSCAMVSVGGQELPAGTDGRLHIFPHVDDVVANDISSWNLLARAPDGTCPDFCADSFVPSESAVEGTLDMQIPQIASLPNKMDLALVVDTTGSMCDELRYLQAELSSVVRSVVSNSMVLEKTGDVDVRVAIVLYRDDGDEYVVRVEDFTDINAAFTFLQAAGCDEGGDYPEAMDQALSRTLELQWRSGNVARVAFVVADAPPHDEDLQATLGAALGLRRQGIRLYGLAASGVAETAEYLMRLMSLLTGARYTWLTDDSGIGNPHAEPSVVCYQVTRLDQLLLRVLTGELLGKRVEANHEEIIREVGRQEGGICLVDVMPEPEEEEPGQEKAEEGELGAPTEDFAGDGDSTIASGRASYASAAINSRGFSIFSILAMLAFIMAPVF